MKIYTKTGDKGETSLLCGIRVSKANIRIQLLGQIDKLNSYIGLNISKLDLVKISQEKLLKQARLLRQTQNMLFEIGSEIAKINNLHLKNQTKQVISNITIDLENQIDDMSLKLDKLENFILPGGSEVASYAHLTRTIVREIEIKFVENKETFYVAEFSVFLNRLSDYFFTLARYLNKLEGIEDIIWAKLDY